MACIQPSRALDRTFRGANVPGATGQGNRTGVHRHREAGPLSKNLGRWLTESVADTRAGAAPGGRTYFAPFARVWDSLLRDIESQKGWTLVHADEELGILTVSCRSRLLRLLDDLTIWVGLDANGLTQVEARSVSRGGPGGGANRRRLTGLLDRLEASLGAGARVRTD